MSAWLLPPRPPATPRETQCHKCYRIAAEAICSLCNTERPAYTALKAISAKLGPITATCRYYPKDRCECGERGECLSVA
jgi:hypothetical protein